MTLVVDASAVVAYLVDDGFDGRWAEDVFAGSPLVAPQLLHAEVANVLRRAELAGDIDAETASAAHDDLLLLRVDLAGYATCARRVWELRPSLTVYDAWYVALAEEIGAPLATLDRRLARAPGPRCEFTTPARTA
jgi:predicted nucleic acid-binding protein